MKKFNLLNSVLSLILLISLAATVPFAAAGNVSLFAYWVGANSQSLTVTQGENAQIMVTADSLAPTFSLSVELFQGTQKANTLLKVENLPQDSYTKMLTLGTASLKGKYAVKAKITSYNSQDEVVLALEVKEKATVPPPTPTNPIPTKTNHAPVLNPIGNKSVEVGNVLEVAVSASDIDGDKLTFSASPLPAGATFNTVSGKFKYISKTAGDQNITFKVSDGQLDDSETIKIAVTAKEKPIYKEPTAEEPVEEKNTPPAINNLSAKQVNEGSNLIFYVKASDPDASQKIIYEVDYVPSKAWFNSFTGEFNFTPNYEFVKHPQQKEIVPLKFRAFDGKAHSAWKSLSVTVNDVNRVPVFAEIADVAVYAGETAAFGLEATDADMEDKISFKLLSGPAQAKVVGAAFSWKTTPADLGMHSVKLSVTDGYATVTQEVNIAVQLSPKTPAKPAPIPPAPEEPNSKPAVGSIAPQFGKEGELLQFTFMVFDKNGDKISIHPYSADDILPHLTPISGRGVNIVDNHNGTFTVQMKPLFSFVKHPQLSRTVTLQLHVSDGKETVVKTVAIMIQDVNQIPQFLPVGDQTVYVGEGVFFPVKATDADSEDALSFAVKGTLPAGAIYNLSGFSWEPAKNQAGIYNVVFTVSDGYATVGLLVKITVLENGDDGGDNDDNNNDDGDNNDLPLPQPPKTQCSDGLDNDKDNLIDLKDPGCASPQDDDETNSVPVPPTAATAQQVNTSKDKNSSELNITSVSLDPEEIIALPETVYLYVTVENESVRKAEGLRAIVMIPDLGLVRASPKFDLRAKDDATVGVPLDIPYGTAPGTYLLKILVKNDTAHTLAYRQVTIIR